MQLSLFNAGLSGIRTNMREMQSAAHDVAKQNIGEKPETLKDLSKSMVDLKTSELQAKASIKVIEAGGEVMESIIDIKV